MGQITTCVFDLSEVLMTGMKGIESTIALQVGLSETDVKHQLNGSALTALFHGQLSEKMYWQIVIDTNGWPVSVAFLERVVRSNFQEIPDVRSIVTGLRQKYCLGLLSVHVREWIRFCEPRFNYQQLFDARIYSFEVGVSKPDPYAYWRICAQLRASPEQVLFIDDMLENVQGAQAVGMQGVQFQDARQLRRELNERGVLPGTSR